MAGGAPGQKILSRLVGLPWLDAGRSADMAWFHFGEPRSITNDEDGTRIVGSLALHVQIPWRLSGPGGLMVASGDMVHGDGPDAPFATALGEFRRAAQSRPMVVSAVVADRHQGFAIVLSGGCRLDVFADTRAEVELWRLFVPGDLDTPHAIARPSGMGLE